MLVADQRLLELHRTWQPYIKEAKPSPKIAEEIAQKLKEIGPQKQAAFAKIEQLRREHLSFLQEIVKISSVNPSRDFEKPLASHLSAIMRGMGMEVQQFEPYPQRSSILALYRGSKGKKTLWFNAHLDTVAPGNLADWTFSPFSATVRERVMYGRGVKDCKLGIAASLMAIKTLMECGIKLSHNVLLTFTADEESGGHLGLNHLVQQKGLIKADWAVDCEGEPNRIELGHWGWLQFKLTSRGKAAHSSRKEKGLNAILQMGKVMPAVENMTFTSSNLEQPIVSVNMVEGGFKENVIPDQCTVTVDVCFPMGYTADGLMADISTLLDRLRQEDETLAFEPVKLINLARPSAISRHEPIVSFLQAAVKEVCGSEPEVGIGRHTSDSRWILLDAQVPVVSYSCGGDSGHMPNENVTLEDYIDNIKAYSLLCLLLLLH
ncbi:MAG: ArgE/DapE family deacylase [Chloroflexi bacterium]|nr:ArgE/DapE family deacylase [Chloroflexota bacterium]